MPTTNDSPQLTPTDSAQYHLAMFRQAADFARYCLAQALAAQGNIPLTEAFDFIEANFTTQASFVAAPEGSQLKVSLGHD